MARQARAGLAALLPRAIRVGAGVALIGVLAACGAGTSAGQRGAVAHVVAGSSDTITETGSGLLYPLARTWAQAYHQATPAVTVTTASTGSGTGIADAASGQADVGASDAYLASGDLVQHPTLLNIPLAISAQTIIYNLPDVSQATHVKLNGTVLAEIYSGTVTTWDDPAIAGLNPGVSLPNVKIVPLRRSDSSGDTFLFTSYLSTQDAAWNNAIGYGTKAAWPTVAGSLAESGSVTMMQACERITGCLAYNGISYLSQALAGRLGYASLANSVGNYTLPTAGAVQASVASFVSLTPPNETISMIDGPAPDGYPIVNYEYAIVRTTQPSAAKASDVRAFLQWVITTGNSQTYLGTVGFQPLPRALVTLGEQQIKEIGS